MTTEELKRAGETLYGWGWQIALARALGVNDRTVRRWAAGDTEIPRPTEIAIKALVDNRQAADSRRNVRM